MAKDDSMALAHEILQKQYMSHWYRGKYIFEFSLLEMAIDQCLLYRWLKGGSREAGSEFRGILLDRLTFEAKRTALKSLLDVDAKKAGFIKTKNNSYPNGNLFDRIRQLQEIRNYFAHYFSFSLPNGISQNGDPMDYIICLAENRNYEVGVTNMIHYSQKQFDDLINEIQEIGNKVSDFRGTLLTAH